MSILENVPGEDWLVSFTDTASRMPEHWNSALGEPRSIGEIEARLLIPHGTPIIVSPECEIDSRLVRYFAIAAEYTDLSVSLAAMHRRIDAANKLTGAEIYDVRRYEAAFDAVRNALGHGNVNITKGTYLRPVQGIRRSRFLQGTEGLGIEEVIAQLSDLSMIADLSRREQDAQSTNSSTRCRCACEISGEPRSQMDTTRRDRDYGFLARIVARGIEAAPAACDCFGQLSGGLLAEISICRVENTTN